MTLKIFCLQSVNDKFCRPKPVASVVTVCNQKENKNYFLSGSTLVKPNGIMKYMLPDADTDDPQPMGDPSKTELSDEDQEKFSEKRGEALSAFSEGEWQKAIDLVRIFVNLTRGFLLAVAMPN